MKKPNDIAIIETDRAVTLVAKRFDLNLLLFQILIFLIPVPYFAYLLDTSIWKISIIISLIILWIINNIKSKYMIIIENDAITFYYGLLNILRRKISIKDITGFEETYKKIKKSQGDGVSWGPVQDRQFLQLYIKSKNNKFQIVYSLSNKEKLFIKDFLNEKMIQTAYNNRL